MRRAFTLIEMMISISILAILMLFLYKSYANLNKTNSLYDNLSHAMIKNQKIKKTLYLDFSLALYKSITILNQSQQVDVVFLQSTHSLHRRVNPYIAYVVKDEKLYRVESKDKFVSYPFASIKSYDVDYLGKVKRFRIYKAKSKPLYLMDVVFQDKKELLQKVKVLNEY